MAYAKNDKVKYWRYGGSKVDGVVVKVHRDGTYDVEYRPPGGGKVTATHVAETSLLPRRWFW